ncbi:Uncharacterised protein [uncultured archaeon]|nr:Uncharacterised protein [uncultured archaeon]
MFLTSILKRKNGDDEGVIIAFRNKPKTESKDMKRFCNRLFGYKDHSQKGKYIYERKGLLDEIPNILINPIRSIIIVKRNDAKKVLEFLKEFDAEIYCKEIKLQKEDLEKLEKNKP